MHIFMHTGNDESLTLRAVRCLSLLLIPTKTKSSDGDIPYVIRFVPVSWSGSIGILIVY